MSDQPTGRPPTIGDQLPALRAATWLATTAADMPPVRIGVGPRVGVRIVVESPAALERWRALLAVAPAAVELHAYPGSVWLSVSLSIAAVPVEFTCDVDVPYGVAVRTPAEDAERRRRAALLVQRHDVDDPAVPPLAVAPPVEPIDTLACCDACARSPRQQAAHQRAMARDAAAQPLADALAPDADYQASVEAGYVTPADWSDPAPTQQPDTVAGAFRAVMRGDA
ncbi:hypothetical protein [Actinacidiphila epipremni]|uniref:Uncharacterized protein n=1 Tax=Actinacidiphila epipremni TaxID=2053013 RepID=A0ABX0ZHN3_9ACTN|nr:hypothetical protein [Actinacidiphila epipremni]NJP42307.1 hypothetical protein [Actinacidiphila epipremni]